MYQPAQLHDIAIRTATYRPQSNGSYAAPSPIMAHINYAKEWSITQTPVQSCNSPSRGSTGSAQFFMLDNPPPPPPLPPPQAKVKFSNFSNVPHPKLNKQWSVQESMPALSPKNSISTHNQPHYSAFTFNTDENKNNMNNTNNMNNVYNIATAQYENIETINLPPSVNSSDDDNESKNNNNNNNNYEQTPVETPQPSAFNISSPNNNVNNGFPAHFPTNNNNNNNINNNNQKRASDKSFKTISDSSSNPSSSSTDDSSTSTDTDTDSEDDATTQQQSYTESEFNQISDDLALSKYGYKILKKICPTIHGCVYEAKIIDIETKDDDDNDTSNVHGKDFYKPRNSLKLNSQTTSLKNCFNISAFHNVAIKKVDKKMVEMNSKISSNNENIMKEAIILNYLSVLNKPPADNICEYIDFIETETDFYLIQEYGGNQTLTRFIQIAHKYIQEKKLKLKHWRITVKFIFWQMTVMLYWMHNDMNVCHLDMNADNILIKNGDFYIHKKDGSITVDSKNLSVKISDFGFAEIFSFQTNSFLCSKRGYTKDHAHKAPQQYNGQTFDARKSDCYSLGVLLFEMLTGNKPYITPNENDEGFLALKSKELANYLCKHGLSKHVYRSTLSLVEGLINIDEHGRMDTEQILKHEWFQHYYDRYRLRIQQKTKSQKERHQRQHKKIKVLPYYILNTNINNTKHCVL